MLQSLKKSQNELSDAVSVFQEFFNIFSNEEIFDDRELRQEYLRALETIKKQQKLIKKLNEEKNLSTAI
nr:hypothetical protein [uncultured Flavobacterium sp.]